MICPHCNKEIVRKFKMKDYDLMIEKLKHYDGKNLTTNQVLELLKDFYSPMTSVYDYTFVKKNILKKVGWGLFLVQIPKRGDIK